MTEQRNREGQQLGNYRLERLLGQGGFAEVYLGHHLRLKRQAAIKVLHAYLPEKEIDAFQKEAEIIAGLEHPHIVRVLDFDIQNGVPFLVMDYLPNGTLRQRHSRGEQVPLPTVVSYVKQVAEALQFAHEQRLVHRDVKPENMLIGRRNEVVLSDFGIAAIAHSTSSMTAQASMGTIPYMAPEQIQEHPRAASDQYSLGIVVYEWLSGKLPFDGSFTEIFAKHLMTPPPSLRQKAPALSAEVEQVVLTALAKDPGQRFGSIQAFATALESASQATQQPSGAAYAETILPQPSPSLPPTVLAAPPVATPADIKTPPTPSLAPTVAASPPARTFEPTVAAFSSAEMQPSIARMPQSSVSSGSPGLFQLSGWALFVSGVIGIVQIFLDTFLFLSGAYVDNPLWKLEVLLNVAATILLLSGLPGLHVKQSGRAGPLGIIGIAMIFASCFGFIACSLLLFPPAINSGQYDGLYNASNLLSIVGYILLGIVIVRAKIFPRWTGIVLIVTSIVSVIDFSSLSAALNPNFFVIANASANALPYWVAIAGCGYVLLSRRKVLSV